MTQAPIRPTPSVTKKLTFEEYLVYEDGTETHYELDRGQLIPMPTATALHSRICHFLVYLLQRYVTENNLNLVVLGDVGVRTGIDSSRIPDVMVCTPELWDKICGRSGAGVLDLEEMPNLVIEVTSENWRTDYIQKRGEYAFMNITEYWIINPNKNKVHVLLNPEQENGYEQQDFVPGQTIYSTYFPKLNVSVDGILYPPTVEELMKIEQTRVQQVQRQRDEAQQQLDEAQQQLDEAQQQRDEAQQQRDEARKRTEKLEALLREQGFDLDTI
ncbi:MAG: Uma2 family endonuclease [Microcystaceae cyanobacterium]